MTQEIRKQMRFDKIDGIRTYAAIGIVLMHVLANGSYELDGIIFNQLIPSFTDFVFLFMVISGFSMCCGYYEKIITGKILPEQFFKKRFQKVWPFFAFLCLLDFTISPSVNSLYEVIANLTLCFGLIPNANISVIGVGWFLGLVFVFYFLFPFFCYLLSDKRRAWLSFGLALIMNYLCVVRFDAGRTNIAYSAVFFLCGGLVYIYRDILQKLANSYGILLIVGLILSAWFYYAAGNKVVPILLWCALALIFALRANKHKFSFLSNPVVYALSKISMEIYLSHMVIFRVLEKMNLLHITDSDAVSYAVAATGTIVGTVIFSMIMSKSISWAEKRLIKHNEV